MKALKTMAAAAVTVMATSSAAMAQELRMNPVTDHLEAKWNETMDALQSSVGLDFLSREGFYVVAGIAAVLVLYGAMRVMRAAQDADELAKQRRVVKARRQAEAEYESAEAKRQRRYGG